MELKQLSWLWKIKNRNLTINKVGWVAAFFVWTDNKDLQVFFFLTSILVHQDTLWQSDQKYLANFLEKFKKRNQNDNTVVVLRCILKYVYSLDGYNDFCTNKCFELVKSYLEAQCDKKSFLQILLLQRTFTTYTEKN